MQRRAFGDEPIVISVRGDLATEILEGRNLIGLLDLEGRAARLPGVRAVFGPGTFVNQTVVQTEKVVRQGAGAGRRRRAERAADDARAAPRRSRASLAPEARPQRRARRARRRWRPTRGSSPT